MHTGQGRRPFSLHCVHLRSWCTCVLEVALPYRSRSAFLSPPQSWQMIKPSPPQAVHSPLCLKAGRRRKCDSKNVKSAKIGAHGTKNINKIIFGVGVFIN